ncbi:hypothetical protein N0664_05045 [Pseudomonas aeruginosa]|nr:hypothetical protein [uncultured Pseudomonas sp.]MCT1015632.1 hypothetical protein [Pseudomonas aeruginosa]
MPNFIGYIGRLNEEIVRSLGAGSTSPGNIDHGINEHVSHMYPLRPKLSCDRLSENTLSCFGRGKPREVAFASKRRGIPCGDDRTGACLDHRGGDVPCQVKKRHDINLEVSIQDGGINLYEVPKGATNGVVNNDIWWAKVTSDQIQRLAEACRISDINWLRLGVGNAGLDGLEPIRVSRNHGDVVATFGESANNR